MVTMTVMVSWTKAATCALEARSATWASVLIAVQADKPAPRVSTAPMGNAFPSVPVLSVPQGDPAIPATVFAPIAVTVWNAPKASTA